jgi:hypothetical protein
MKNLNVFSFDAETNGLWGQAFAISAAVYNEGKMIAVFTGYLGPDGVTDAWVKDNVLPNLKGLKQTHASYDEMLKDFSCFYMEHKKDKDVIAHMGVPVEAKILLDMHQKGFIGDWDGPYPFLDVASVLKAKGYDPSSVDSYNKEFGLMDDVPEAVGLSTHHPLYDSVAAARAYLHLMNR